MVEFRDYQKDIIAKGTEMIRAKGFLYLAMEVRTGKTLTSLGICEQLNVDNVLFLTKKKAMSSIIDDYDMLCPNSFALFVINYESIHKVPNIRWDVIICDEAHSMGAFPKPSNRAKDVKSLIQRNDPHVILMSGTPTPE
jgi:superfamily II DNA or RNA helicase